MLSRERTFIDRREAEAIVRLAQLLAEMRVAAALCEKDARACDSNRRAARVEAHIRMLTGFPVVSLIRGFTPEGRRDCGCVTPASIHLMRKHNGRAHVMALQYLAQNATAYGDAMAASHARHMSPVWVNLDVAWGRL